MSTSKNIIMEALALPIDDKAELVDQLLSQIDQLDKDIEAKWAAEAESRIDAYEAGKLRTVSLEEVLAKYK
jgi:putative addiction module component (TIGR02574 family)